MDLVCTCCGEPWAFDHVIHEAEPEDFRRVGGLILACPSCGGRRPSEQSPEERDRLDGIAELARWLGEDLDGLAGLLEDFGLV